MTVTILSKTQETLLEQRAETDSHKHPNQCFLSYCSLFAPHPRTILTKYLRLSPKPSVTQHIA